MKDLKLTGNKFNIALTIFYVPYILVDVPSNWVLKYFGAGVSYTVVLEQVSQCLTIPAISAFTYYRMGPVFHVWRLDQIIRRAFGVQVLLGLVRGRAPWWHDHLSLYVL